MCVMSTIVAKSMVTTIIRLTAVSACAPLSFQREQNYKRSPYSGVSNSVRGVEIAGVVHGPNALSGGLGVRPALFSEGTEL